MILKLDCDKSEIYFAINSLNFERLVYFGGISNALISRLPAKKNNNNVRVNSFALPKKLQNIQRKKSNSQFFW
jgi:hypothetical protein